MRIQPALAQYPHKQEIYLAKKGPVQFGCQVVIVETGVVTSAWLVDVVDVSKTRREVERAAKHTWVLVGSLPCGTFCFRLH